MTIREPVPAAPVQVPIKAAHGARFNLHTGPTSAADKMVMLVPGDLICEVLLGI